MEPGKFDSQKIAVQEILLRIVTALQNMPLWERGALVIFILLIFPGFFAAKYGAGYITEQSLKKYIVTARPSFSDPKPVTSEPVAILSILPGEYAAYARITNPNFELTTPNARYEVKFVNAKNEVVASRQGTFFLLPGQSKYIVIPRIISTEKITKGTIVFSDVAWQKRTNIPTVQLRASDVTRTNQLSPQAFVAEGDVLNNSTYRLEKLSITLLLYDRNNKIIGVSSRDEFDVEPKTRRAYKQTWSGVFASDVSRIEVQAETNTADDENLRLETAAPAPSSLGRPKEEQ